MSRETFGVGAVAVGFFVVLALVAWASSAPRHIVESPPVIAVRPAPEKSTEEFAAPVTVVGVPSPEPPTLLEDAVSMAVARSRVLGGALSAGELLLLLAWTGWPIDWWDEAAVIGWCESKWSPAAVGDGGQSLGLMQLWSGWFLPGEDAFDPTDNLRVGLRVRTIRGRFGGNGGWSCADLNGIP